MALSVHTVGPVLVIVLPAIVDRAAIADWQPRLAELLAGHRAVVLDCQAVIYLDSFALNELYRLLETTEVGCVWAGCPADLVTLLTVFSPTSPPCLAPTVAAAVRQLTNPSADGFVS